MCAGTNTQVDLTIGPNPFLGFVLIAVFAMLVAGALILSWISITTSFASVRLAATAWVVVGGYGGLFFVAPALDHPRESRYLISFLERTLDAIVTSPMPSSLEHRHAR